MAIKFYLHSITNANEIHCNTNSSITELAGVFDIGTLKLEWNECKYALIPNTLLFIVDTESNEQWDFVINEDNVEVVQKRNPIKYLHTLTVSQSIHKINNVPLRNTVFSQPFDSQKRFKKGTTFVGYANYESDGTYIGVSYHYDFDHAFNSLAFLKDNYSMNLSAFNHIKGATFKVTSVICGYEHISYSNEAGYGNNTFHDKLRNNGISSVTFSIIDTSNDTTLFTKTASLSNFNQDISFTDAEISLMVGKTIVLRVTDATTNSSASNLVPNQISISEAGNTNLPMICGLLNIEINFDLYKYSLWDVLDTLNKQCIKRYNYSNLSAFYTMPDKTTGQGLELNSIPAPEFNFTQMDLYEAVAQVMSYIDAFPIFISGNTLGYQYLNDLSEDTIENLELNDLKTTLNETNFTNKLATYYQNAKKDKAIVTPAINLFRTSTTSKFGVPDPNDWYGFVDKNIDYIDSFTILYGNAGVSQINLTLTSSIVVGTNKKVSFNDVRLSMNPSNSGGLDIDLKPVIFRSDIYNELPVGYANSSSHNQNNSLYYSHNDNKVYLGRLGTIDDIGGGEKEVLYYAIARAFYYNIGFGFYPYTNATGVIRFEDINKRALKFNCVYHAIVDGKVSQESYENKVEKETLVAQSSSGVELNRLGNNLQGLIAKLGNEEKSVTLPITKMKDRVKVGTHYIDELGNNWIVNRVKTTFTTKYDKIIVEATFTKNYNAMQQFTRLNQEKRFYEISQTLTSKGYETITEFIYFTTNSEVDVSSLRGIISFKRLGLLAIFGSLLHNDIESELIATNNSFNLVDIQFDTTNPIITTPVVYGSGNQLCFEIGFNDSTYAGNYISDGNCRAKLYVENNGECNTVNINGYFSNKNTWYEVSDYPAKTSSIGTNIFAIESFDYYKKPNEIFHLNYSLAFLPYWVKTTDDLGNSHYTYEEIYFGDAFINENGIIPNSKNSIYVDNPSNRFTLWVSNNKYSITDQQAQGTKVNGTITVNWEIDSISYDRASYGNITISVNGTLFDTTGYSSWCLADENNRILFAVNKNSNSTKYANLRWFTSRYRKV